MGKIEATTYRRRRRRSSRANSSRLAPPTAPVEQTVLVVESDPDVQAQMARTFRRQGYRVVGTGSGGGALALIAEWQVDLILVSADLPGRAGVDLASQLHHAAPHTRVVVVANQVEPDVSQAALAAGAVGCVPKPLELKSLTPWLPATNNALPTHEAVAE